MPKPEIFFVTPELQQVLDSLPDDQPRSKIEPFKMFILRWKRQGRSNARIAAILSNECKVQVSGEAVRKFIKLRSRPRKPQPNIDFEPVAVQPVTSSSAAVQSVERKPRTAEERAAARAAIRSSFEKPLFPEERKPLFERRPGPIRNLNNEKLGDKENGSSVDNSGDGGEEAGTNK